MTELLQTIHLALPEIIILMTAVIALLANLFLGHRIPSIAYGCSLLGLLAAAIPSILFIGQYSESIFNGLFISDDLSQLMKLFIYLSVALSFAYSNQYIRERNMPAADYYVLGLFATLGMMILVSAGSLLTIYLGLELLSLPLYAMTAFRRDSAMGAEAAMKYFIMGSVASAILLYGMSLLYAATGELGLVSMSQAIVDTYQQQGALLCFALAFILAAIGFKMAAVPFHMWAPDVYSGAPTAVTLFISTAPKIAGMAMIFRLLTLGLGDLFAQWQYLILCMALLSTAFGNLFAVAQTNVKRLFAYSTISHMGYALFGIVAGDSNGYSAALFYVIIYSIMSAGAFGLLVLMSRSGIEIEQISQLKGLNKRNPWLAFLMMVVMFSMAGVPPTVGFFAKLLVLKSLVDVHLMWAAILGLVFAVIGAFYYLSIVKVMYFDEAEESKPIKLERVGTYLFSINALALIYLGIFPASLISMCSAAFL